MARDERSAQWRCKSIPAQCLRNNVKKVGWGWNEAVINATTPRHKLCTPMSTYRPTSTQPSPGHWRVGFPRGTDRHRGPAVQRFGPGASSSTGSVCCRGQNGLRLAQGLRGRSGKSVKSAELGRQASIAENWQRCTKREAADPQFAINSRQNRHMSALTEKNGTSYVHLLKGSKYSVNLLEWRQKVWLERILYLLNNVPWRINILCFLQVQRIFVCFCVGSFGRNLLFILLA